MEQLSPVSIQTQSLALRALRKRKPQETQALVFLAVFVYATLTTQAIVFEWKPGLITSLQNMPLQPRLQVLFVSCTTAY